MTKNIDQLPYYDPISAGSTMKISDVWMAELSSLIQTLQGYLSAFGDFIPPVTTAERALIQSPVEGQMIYNTDATPGPPRSAAVQIWQVKAGVGAWRTFTTVP